MGFGVDAIDEARAPLRIQSRTDPHCADLLHRTLRPNVSRSDNEDHPLDEPEGVAQHQALHLSVVSPTPVGSSEKGPADLDLAPRFIVAVKARRSNHAAVPPVNRNQRAARLQRLAEEAAERRLAPAVADR